ncbi:MAG: helix-turn-helix transcriptional regulator [Clostridia bacterium]|nr:helix-turn-helix transcriptional regulator [Clostridia bacterium]
MDELTKLIKKEIKRQFRSVRQFSMYIGVPQSTIVTALQKGIGGTSFETIMKICDVLDIKLVAGDSHVFLDGENRALLERYSRLDAEGKKAVRAVAEIELLRVADPDAFAELGKKLDDLAVSPAAAE